MSDLTLPSGILISKFTFGQRTFDASAANASSGAEQVQILGPSRWLSTIGCETNLNPKQAALWRQLLTGLRGRANRLLIHDLANPLPRGTMRGVMSLSSAAAAGANTFTLTAAGQGGKTLLVGDWLSVGSGLNKQLVVLQADAVANGAGAVSVVFEPVLRAAQAAGASLSWDKPAAYFRSTTSENTWEAAGPTQGGFQMSFVESWEV